ncbi:hypothetical protein GARC_1318 [Paraglaciecola arctica BSs20135]|uniref:Uncharacterized protein n=1 Tax=Paraglaciecola arctica BSs20135 TaxID=493475 RepID=K6XCF8_9ALTE|nr:hypothetical protein GARC_1318 [Paraglaciecola arctica BSs20135]
MNSKLNDGKAIKLFVGIAEAFSLLTFPPTECSPLIYSFL